MLKHKLVNRKLLLVFFVVLLINWVMIILSTRINDVTLSDTLGLFSLLPSGYIVSLFVLVFLTAVSIYLHENVAAILFAGLFALYFSGTPWIIEPLRVPDAIAHFSGAALVAISGHMPPTSNYYFDYPGSSLFGSSFLLITGLNSILVLKVFPLLIMAIFYLNFSVLIHSIFKDSRVVSLGLLVASIFGYGAMHFSPAGIAQMLFPLMLFTVGRKKYSVCFFVLTFSLVILNPTICAFLACTLFLYLTVLRLMELRINRIVLYEAVFFAFTFLSWTLYNSPRVLFQIGDFIRQLLDFSFGKGTIQGLSPPISPLVGLSVARRIFVGLSGILVAVILLFAMSLFVKRRRARPRVSQYVGDMIGPSMILVGLALTLLFFIAVPSNPFGSRGISLYLLGASLSVGFFNLKSGKTLLLLTILLSSLIIPAFIFAYPQEQSDITRSSVMQGLAFTGNQLVSNPGVVLCPFSGQLNFFTSYDMWDRISSMGIPYHTGGHGFDLLYAKYVVYRVDAQYYSLMNNAPYIEASNMSNSSGFNQIYSSGSYVLFLNTGNVSQVSNPPG